MRFLSIEIEDRPDCQELQDTFENLTGARSVPRVFIDGKSAMKSRAAEQILFYFKTQSVNLKLIPKFPGNFVGGGTDVKKLYETGQLQKMLA